MLATHVSSAVALSFVYDDTTQCEAISYNRGVLTFEREAPRRKF